MRTSRSHLLTVALIALALVGVVSLAIPSSPFHRDVKKGLDLQGGLEVVLEAQAPPGHKLTAVDLDRSVQIMRNRIDKLGVSSPEIRKQGSNQIVIQLAGITTRSRRRRSLAVPRSSSCTTWSPLSSRLRCPLPVNPRRPGISMSFSRVFSRLRRAARRAAMSSSSQST
jgi:preprotein translocase subunit SecD